MAASNDFFAMSTIFRLTPRLPFKVQRNTSLGFPRLCRVVVTTVLFKTTATVLADVTTRVRRHTDTGANTRRTELYKGPLAIYGVFGGPGRPRKR